MEVEHHAEQRTEHGVTMSWGSPDLLVCDPPPVATSEEEREIVVPGVATFRVTGGRRVLIERADDADPVEVGASIAGRVTAALLQQRRTLPLHLASVVLEGRAVAFAGPPGTGKSSLACALVERGHLPLTDDLAAVTTDEAGRVLLHPGRPVLRIWGPSARQLGWPAGDRNRIKQGVDKYAYALPDRFAREPAALDAIYVLVDGPADQPADEVLVEPVGGFTKFEVLFTGATYSREYLDSPEARAWHFAEVIRTGEHIRVFTVRRPYDAALQRVAAEVEGHAIRSRA